LQPVCDQNPLAKPSFKFEKNCVCKENLVFFGVFLRSDMGNFAEMAENGGGDRIEV
jgi:hypothetical protein